MLMIARCPKSPDAPSAGFILMELLIIIAIAGILAVIGIWSMTGLIARMKVMGAADLLKSQLIVARTRAITNPLTHCGVYYDRTNNRSLVFFDNNGDNAFTSGTDQILQNWTDLPKLVQLYTPSGADTIAGNVFIFRGDGSVKNGGGIGVHYKNKPTTCKTVYVVKTTGNVEITQ